MRSFITNYHNFSLTNNTVEPVIHKRYSPNSLFGDWKTVTNIYRNLVISHVSNQILYGLQFSELKTKQPF